MWRTLAAEKALSGFTASSYTRTCLPQREAAATNDAARAEMLIGRGSGLAAAGRAVRHVRPIWSSGADSAVDADSASDWHITVLC